MKTSIFILLLAVLLFSIAGICHATPMYLSPNGTAQAVIVDDAIERMALDHLIRLNRLTNPDVADWITQAEANSMAVAFVTDSAATDNHWVADSGDMRNDYESILNGILHVNHNGLTIPTTTSPVVAHNKKDLLYYIKINFVPAGYCKDHFYEGVDEIILGHFW